MAADLRPIVHKIWRTVSSIEVGVVLLILVAIFSALGATVLQRPVTSPGEMQSAYTPQALRILDAIGLTSVFHSWWFLGLVFLVSLCILAASVNFFPSRWCYFSRPYKYPDERFRRTVHPQRSLLLVSTELDDRLGEETGLAAAERALQISGYNPERIARQDRLGVFAERHRVSELAVYIVHSGLLLIFFGTFVNGLWGWRGTINLNEGQSSDVAVMRDGTTRKLPFSIRCDSAGLESLKDSVPNKWWSKLAIVKAGQDVQDKKIAANDPLLSSGFRFSLSSYGTSNEINRLILTASPQDSSGRKREMSLALNDAVSLDADTSVRFAEFFPDYAVREGQPYPHLNQMRNPAAHLVLTSKKLRQDFDVWLPQPVEIANSAKAPWKFQTTELRMGRFTELEVSHQPGQWGVWSGAALLGIGLALAFYLVHRRLWVVPVRDPKTGKLLLWIGGSTNRDRNGFEVRFNDLVSLIERELKLSTCSAPQVQLSMSQRE